MTIYFPSKAMVDQITKGDYCLFRDVITRNELTEIDFSYKDLTPEQAPFITEAIQGLNVRCLNLSHNHLGPQGALALAHGLQDTLVSALDLTWNGIGHAVVELFKQLASTSVKELYLASNHIGLQTSYVLRPLMLRSNIKVDLRNAPLWK